jgi:hypothetical protein
MKQKIKIAPLVQLVERKSPKFDVVGSIPTGRVIINIWWFEIILRI